MEKVLNKVLIFSRLFSGIAMIAGTTIGAGMLGIPLLTYKAGFLPAASVTCLTWLFMLITGLILVEVVLKKPTGTNLLSLAESYLGRKGKFLAGGMFLFLYFCLLVAYVAAGSPLMGNFLQLEGPWSYLFFTLFFGSIVAYGAKVVGRINSIFTLAMIVFFGLLISGGVTVVNPSQLLTANWSMGWLAIPLLFSAFGYHNIIPSVCDYLQRDKKAIYLSVIIGTAIPLVVYLLWQWVLLGAVPPEALKEALEQGKPATEALQAISSRLWIATAGKYFAFFALTTSLMGVALSVVDFLNDALAKVYIPLRRWTLCCITFILPLFCALLNPTIFDKALGFAGGFGEAFLNGILPVWLLWVCQKKEGLQPRRFLLILLLILGFSVMGLEIFML